jgi:hypothetical protein
LPAVSIRVSREVKEKMLKYKDRVNWAQEIRGFLEARIRQIEAEENIEKAMVHLSRLEVSAPKGSSAEYLRQDRDSH